MNLEFGLSMAVPVAVKTAWGARLIFPDDLVYDRQDTQGPATDKPILLQWLRSGAGDKARANARAAAEAGTLRKDQDKPVILFKDEQGVFVGNPNASHGYLYVAAWLHGGNSEKQPGPEFQSLEIPKRRPSRRS